MLPRLYFMAGSVMNGLLYRLTRPWRRIVYHYENGDLRRVPDRDGVSALADEGREGPKGSAQTASFLERLVSNIVHRLGDDDVLIINKRILVPRRDLVGQFIANNITSLVPLSPDQIVVRHTISNMVENGFSVDIAVVDRKCIDRLWALDRQLGLRGDCIELCDSRFSIAKVSPHVWMSSVKGLVTTLLLLALPILYALTLQFRIAQNHETLQALEQSVLNARILAEKLRDVRNDIERRESAISTLNVEKSKTPHLVLLLEDITQHVPDTAWLTQFQLQGHKITVSGFAESVNSVITALNQSGRVTNASAAGSIVFDPIQKAERFTISATLRSE